MADLTKRFFLYSIIILNFSYIDNKVEIQSYILRDRLIVADGVLMKKALYVAFFVNKGIGESKNMKVKGQLLNNNKLLAETSTYLPNEDNSSASPFNKGGQRGILNGNLSLTSHIKYLLVCIR